MCRCTYHKQCKHVYGSVPFWSLPDGICLNPFSCKSLRNCAYERCPKYCGHTWISKSWGTSTLKARPCGIHVMKYWKSGSESMWWTFCAKFMSSVVVGALYPSGGRTWEKSRYRLLDGLRISDRDSRKDAYCWTPRSSPPRNVVTDEAGSLIGLGILGTPIKTYNSHKKWQEWMGIDTLFSWYLKRNKLFFVWRTRFCVLSEAQTA